VAILRVNYLLIKLGKSQGMPKELKKFESFEEKLQIPLCFYTEVKKESDIWKIPRAPWARAIGFNFIYL
jgi:hypothetical protein